MMDDLISRQAAIDAVGSMLRRKFGIGGDLAEITLSGLPTADVVERKDLDKITEEHERIGYGQGYRDGYAQIDVEVVRCKECKYYNLKHHYCEGIGNWFGFEDEWSDNGFCYKGERRE